MSVILATGAVVRLLAARDGDQWVGWLESERVSPFIDPITMATVKHAIETSAQLSAAARRVLELRYAMLAAELKANTRRRVTAVEFDLNCATALADLLAINIPLLSLSEIDLVPAAIAMEHNFHLVITEHVDAWTTLAEAIEPDLGRLQLRPV